MRRLIVRWGIAGLLLVAFTGCQALNLGSPKPPCPQCLKGECPRHGVGVPTAPEPLTSPGPSPFTPFTRN